MKPVNSFLFPILSFGCETFQEPVDNSLLAEMTQQEKDTISAIDNSTTTRKNEEDASEKVVGTSDQATLVSTTKLKLLAAFKVKEGDYQCLSLSSILKSKDRTGVPDTSLW